MEEQSTQSTQQVAWMPSTGEYPKYRSRKIDYRQSHVELTLCSDNELSQTSAELPCTAGPTPVELPCPADLELDRLRPAVLGFPRRGAPGRARRGVEGLPAAELGTATEAVLGEPLYCSTPWH